MEKQYGSPQKLKTAYEQTHRFKLLVDLENWEYYKEHPEETLELSEILINNDISLSKLDFKILDIIKNKKPRSIREVAEILDKSVSNVQPRLKKLEKEGFVTLVEGNKNSLVPTMNYDEIKISI
ncbi:MAG: winged helix-turn-helix transcriptional regulator [Methanosphaera sp.]|nr:winged helix-turn-helix transcriptional regulator [Methanosphaera sp.]